MTEDTAQVYPSPGPARLRVYPGISLPSGSTAGEEDVTSDQATVRAANLALVLTGIFSTGGGVSRADVAASTGLTRATSSRLAADLLTAEIIEEGAPSAESRMGRPSTPLFPKPGKIVGVGLEVNVDHIGGIAIDLAGNVVDQFVRRGDNSNSDPAVTLRVLGEDTAAMCRRLKERGVQEIGAVTIGVPGLVNAALGEVLYAPNLGWEAVRPADYLAECFPPSTPLHCHNDADLQAVAAANALDQGGRRLRSFMYISGDTGVGGAIVLEDSMLTGDRGWAGEIGHTVVSVDGPLCHCGANGCLETYAGWRAIATNAGFDWRQGAQGLVPLLRSGDERAQQAVDKAGWALAVAVSNAVKLLDVRTIVLGTGLALLLPWLEPALEAEVDARRFPPGADSIELIAAPTQGMPTVIGAALRALQTRLEKPEVRGGMLDS